ncbi:MAG: ABC transporter ATP-binding protein [Gammaproteobacteria bacterium]|nr:ABC transporter ATP-binding protein [Gammaproteobacteria bacterium]
MLLRAQQITVVRNNRRLLDAVSIDLAAGELVGLIGPNGAGKSTLLNVLAGLIKPEQGEVLVEDLALAEFTPAERGRTLAWMEQSGPIHWPLSVERLITLGRRPHLSAWQRPGPEDSNAINRAIAATDCAKLLKQDATTLSGGERTRVLLARALATEPKILLADEPIAALDLGHQLQTMEVLKQFTEGSRGCLVVLHDLTLAARFCDRLYLLNDGQLAAAGDPWSVLEPENLRQVYGVEILRGEEEGSWVVPVRRI